MQQRASQTYLTFGIVMIWMVFMLGVVVWVSTCSLSVVGVQLSWSSKLQEAVCSAQWRSPGLTWSKPMPEYSMVVNCVNYTYSIYT